MILTHISARHSEEVEQILKEAREVFEESEVAHDLMVIEVPYRD